MIRSALLFSVACLSIDCQSGNPKKSAPPPQAYKLESGPYPVASIEDLTLRDERRAKDLKVTIRYPKGEGIFPVLIFSHGLGGAGTHYFSLTQHWVSHGYVVLQPTHADSIPAGERFTRKAAEKGLEDPAAAENRAADDSFLIDSIDLIQKKAPELAGRMDAKRIGVAGHSFGAHTTQMLAGALYLGKSFSDSRINAFILLSGQGSGRAGFDEKSWEKVERPVMVMSGSLDKGAMGEEPSWRMEPYRRFPAGDKYSVFLEGAAHMSFTGALVEGNQKNDLRSKLMKRATKGTDQNKVFDAVKAATLAFWDRYLRDDPSAKTYLDAETLAPWDAQAVRYSKK